MKRDIYCHEKRYKNWKEEVVEFGIVGLTKKNADYLINYVFDMEIGVNVSKKNKKGARSYPRLNNIRQRLRQIMIMLQERGVNDITRIEEKEVIQFFTEMHTGSIKTKKGEQYRSVGDYAKVFTSFWHWWMKVNRKEGKMLIDISEELDKSSLSSRFVYVTKEQIDEMLPYFEEDEQTIILFVFDSIIRAPTELMSLKVKNLFKEKDIVWVNIPSEISKTNFQRSFNLLYCGDSIIKYIEKKKLNPEDYLFDFNHLQLTKKLHKVAEQLWGEGLSHPVAEGKFSNLGLYDLRHSGAIHLRILASRTGKINLDAIRQRGGWVDFKMLNYYTKFIGLDGSIDKNDLLIEEDKTRLEKEIEELKNSNQIFSGKMMKFFEILQDNPQISKLLVKKEMTRMKELFG